MGSSSTKNLIRAPINEMTCSACATRIEKALGRVDGVGIAMGSGTDVAMETASVTLMRWKPQQN